MRMARDGSNAIPLSEVHAQEVRGADGALLGTISVKVDKAAPGKVMMPRVHSATWWHVAPFLVCPGALPWAI
jgi:hypothetical protein